jgi:DNA-binding MarR family transcriptional regulator
METRKSVPHARGAKRERALPAHEQANEARLLILAAQREGNRMLVSALRPLGMTPAQAEVVSVLAQHEPLTVAALGNYIVCESGSPSRLVDNCVRHGWVERTEGPDRRTVLLRLAPAGRTVVPEIEKVDNAIGSMIATIVGDRALRTLTDSLRLMLEGTESGEKVVQRFHSTAP